MSTADPGTWLPLLALADLPEEGIVRATPPGLDPVAICRTGGAIHVVGDLCTHGLASLSEGEIFDGQIVCPFHGGSFDLKTGAAVEAPCTIAIPVYEARIADGMVEIRRPGGA